MRQNITKSTVVGMTTKLLIILGGSFVMGFSNIAFLYFHDIVPGGFTGFAMILNKTIMPFISPGTMSIILNIPLFAIAIKLKGKNFGIFSLIGMLAYSGVIDLVLLFKDWEFFKEITQITKDNPLLAAIYGGIILGIGYGIVVRQGGSTGGSDMLANLIGTYKTNISFGTILLLIDGLVVALSGIAFSIKYNSIQEGIQPALYAFLVIYLFSKVADFVIEGKQSTRAYYIITDKTEEIAQMLLNKIGRGVTVAKVRGAYSRVERDMLLCVVRRGQSAFLKRNVFETDPRAFVFSVNAVEVLGEGFRPPELKKKTKAAVQALPSTDPSSVAQATPTAEAKE